MCWDQLSTTTRTACRASIDERPIAGILDRSRDSNPFRSYTIVHILSCSGDLHIGDVKHWYIDPKGVPVEQRGCR